MRANRLGFAIVAVSAMILSGCLGAAEPKAAQGPAPLRQISAGAKQAVPLCDYKFDGTYSQVCAVGPFGEVPFVRKYLASKLDGADIEVGYWIPDAKSAPNQAPEDGKFPVVVMASPYFGNLGPAMHKRSGYLMMLTQNFIQHGYAVAGVSVRGTGDSGGCMDLMGKKELADLDQAITWIGEQEWSDGNIGMIGLSYDGSTPWSVAAMGNKYLKTIIPISGVPDIYGLMYKNGSAELRGPFLLNALYYVFFARTDPPTTEKAAVHTAQGIVCPESWVGLAASGYSGVYGERDPAGWMAERNRKPLVAEKYKGSILSVQGMQDWNVDPTQVIPWVDELNRTGLFTHQLLGQWGHSFPDTNRNSQQGRNQRWDWAEILLNWLDYHLKGMTTIDLGPAVQVQDQTGRWRAEEHFPPRDAQWTTLHLGNGNQLQKEPGAAGSMILHPWPFVGETAAQNVRSFPGYQADFYTPPLETDLRISGLPRLHVTASPKGPTGHLAAWLYSVEGTKDPQRIGWTQINLMFADGSEKAKPIVPNTPLLAKMEYQPLDAFVPAGNRLLVRVWQFQDADRLPAIPPEPVELMWGGSTKSTLELPLVERTEDDYFQPPRPK